MSVLLFFCVFL